MNIARLLEHSARVYARETAIAWSGAAFCDYRTLYARAGSVASSLQAAGLERGARVCLAMANTPVYFEILFGCWTAGLVAAPMNARLHPREIVHAARDCGAKLCFATGDLAPALRETFAGAAQVVDVDADEYAGWLAAAPSPIMEAEAEAPAWLFYTSGTTGKSKGAIHTHRTLWNVVTSFLADSGAVERDNILHLAPLSHAAGFLGLAYLSRGRANIILPTGGLDVAEIEAAAPFAPFSLWAVPTVLNRLCELLPAKTRTLIFRMFVGGAPVYAEDLKRAISLFGAEKLWILYGQGEAPMTLTHLPPRLFGAPQSAGYEARLGSVGVARTGVAIRVVSSDGADAQPGEIGEVAARGDVVMAGYWNNPSATAAAIPDGWLRTGDLGMLDGSGFLTLVDRSKDMIISGGSNIYPREIEEVLLTHPRVKECAVVGAPDPQWGETPVAFIVASGAAPSADELDALCLGNLARYKRPRAYRFIGELPKSSYGKILKSALRERL